MFFSYSELLRLLRFAKSVGKVLRLRDWNGQPGLILRHDVDLDVEPAVQLAHLEMEADVRSTFFFLVTCDWYNVASLRNRRALRQLADLGFEVGLHFDPLIYTTGNLEELDQMARREADVLSEICGAEVTSVSIHNPSIHGLYSILPSFMNAYDPRVFASQRYLSDSQMRVGSDPWEFVRRASSETIQLLLHPLHFSATGAPYPAMFIDYALRRLDALHETFLPNVAFSTACPQSLRGPLGEKLLELSGRPSVTGGTLRDEL